MLKSVNKSELSKLSRCSTVLGGFILYFVQHSRCAWFRDIRFAVIIAAFLLLPACDTGIPFLAGPSDPPGVAALPDLTISLLNLTPPAVSTATQSVEVSFLVTNIGDGPAEESMTVVELQINGGSSLEDMPRQEFDTPALEPGGTYSVVLSLWFEPLPFGEHVLTVTVANGEMEQADTSNDSVRVELSLPHPCSDVSTPVAFADPWLEDHIAATIGVSTPVTCGELQQLDYLWATATDLSGIEQAHRLRGITVWDSPDVDLAPLRELPALESLGLQNMSVSDLNVVTELPNLRALELVDNEITDLSPLINLKLLERLDISYNQVTDLTPLLQLGHLQNLTIQDNPITDISVLSGLGLVRLSAIGVPLEDLNFIVGMKDLQTLDLGRHSRITETHLKAISLRGPNRLWELMVIDQGISNLEFLDGRDEIARLDLRGNRITDISPLAQLTAPRDVHLQDNLVSDLKPLVDNPGIGEGDTISLQYNCLDLSASSVASQQVATLRGRGVTVHVEPQKACGATVRKNGDFA